MLVSWGQAENSTVPWIQFINEPYVPCPHLTLVLSFAPTECGLHFKTKLPLAHLL